MQKIIGLLLAVLNDRVIDGLIDLGEGIELDTGSHGRKTWVVSLRDVGCEPASRQQMPCCAAQSDLTGCAAQSRTWFEGPLG